jgi:hypothetical protein
VLAALRRALNQTCSLIDTDSHSLAAVATAYLLVDAGFSQNGLITRN